MLRRILFLLLVFPLFISAQTKHPFTFDDMMQLKRVGEPTVSPDSKWVAFSAVDVNLDANTKTPHLWIVPVGGGESKRLTPATGPGEDRIRFSPDGKRVIFESSSQIWVQNFDTATGALAGDPKKVTTISTEASGGTWSPDGKSVLFVSSVFPDCKDDACNQQRDEERAKSQVKARTYDKLMFRHWNHYYDGKKSHLFIVPIEGGVARDLTPGDYDVPPFSLGGQDQYAFSPDGKEIAYTCNTDENEATSTNSDLFVVPVTGGTPNRLPGNPGSDSTPIYSPDGKYIAYRSQLRGGYESDRFRLMLYDRQKARQFQSMTCETKNKIAEDMGHCSPRYFLRDLSPNFDRWVDSIAWSPDSETIYLTAGNEGKNPIYALRLAQTTPWPEELVDGYNDSPTPTPDGKMLVFDTQSIAAPSEIYTAPLMFAQCRMAFPPNEYTIPDCLQSKAKPLTHMNDEMLAKVAMEPMETFWFTGAAKEKVQGFLVRPPGFDKNKKYPMKFLIHGGPQGAWGDDWSYRWNPELFAANGYVVVTINFHGSTGYGQKFIDAINGNWGGAPYEDLMMGLDYAEKTYRFIDKGRECALGASYGGYAINWIEGHTDRFKCLVSHDGMFNTESAFGTTEELWFNEWEFKGTPWTNREMYRKWSPHLYATNFKTPMLIVHGQLDYRLDVSEGFQMFTTLQRLKVPSKLMYFPDEGHWVLKPQNSRFWYQTVNTWVDQWTKPK
jgi:dipeptidyl aminopeptidase/acylaminoacyl peptidase